MATSATNRGARQRPPLGVVLLCLFFVVYSGLWLVTAAFGTTAMAALSVSVAVGVLIVTYLLYTGSAAGWWITLVLIGGSTLWRFTLVVRGRPDNLSNAVGGLVLLAYLVSQYEFYQPLPSGQ
jgi:hypothetical protein